MLNWFERPWLLTALIVFPLFFLSGAYYIRVPWGLAGSRKDYVLIIKCFIYYLAYACLVIATAGPIGGITIKENKALSRRYVLVNDASGSMVSNDLPRGVGDRLKAVELGNDYFLKLVKNGDLVGASVFSDDFFIICYPTTDVKFVKNRLDSIDYTIPPLSWGTRLDLAVWGGIEMILKDKNGWDAVKSRMHKTVKDDNIVDEFSKKNDLSGSSIILFTDGEFYMAEGDDRTVMSMFKLFDLCKKIKVKVFILSVELIDPVISECVVNTGGYTSYLSQAFSPDEFKKAYESILEMSPVEHVVSERVERVDFSKFFAIAGVLFLLIDRLLKMIFFRITEI
jgi:hypothetical protein